LFDDLQALANQVDSVEITNAQGVLFSAQKLGDRWLATFDPEQPVYPVSQAKLSEFVDTMMRVKLVEAKTSKSENYSRLGLQSIEIDDSMASLVTLKTREYSWQVVVGNKVNVGEGHYILKPADPQSWRTDKSIYLPIDKFSWLKQPILPYEEQDISSVSRVDSSDWQIVRAASGDFELINMPNDRELEYASILNSIVTSITSLDFEQLVAIDEKFAQPLKILTQLEVNTAEGKTIQVVVSQLEDKHFVNFNSTGQLEYWQKWYYQISNFSAQQLIKTLDDFLVEESSSISVSNKSNKVIEEGDSPN
jgi:hypothetical protein